MVKIQQVRGAGGVDIHLKRKRDRAEGMHGSLSALSPICGYSSVFISFASVGRHFPKNMALQSEKPSR